MRIYQTDDDDDFPRLSRNDLVELRELLIRIDEAGGINFLSNEEVSSLRSIAKVMAIPGVVDDLMPRSEKRAAGIYWSKVRARWWRFIAWLAGMFAAVAVFVSQLDSVVKAVRGWFN